MLDVRRPAGLVRDGERHCRTHEARVLGVHEQPEGDARLPRADAMPQSGAVAAGRQHERHEQRAEIMRGRVLATREAGAGRRPRPAATAHDGTPAIAEPTRYPQHVSVDVAPSSRASVSTAAARPRGEQQLAAADLEDSRIGTARATTTTANGWVVMREDAEQDGELQRAGRGEAGAGVVQAAGPPWRGRAARRPMSPRSRPGKGQRGDARARGRARGAVRPSRQTRGGRRRAPRGPRRPRASRRAPAL